MVRGQRPVLSGPTSPPHHLTPPPYHLTTSPHHLTTAPPPRTTIPLHPTQCYCGTDKCRMFIEDWAAFDPNNPAAHRTGTWQVRDLANCWPNRSPNRLPKCLPNC